MAEATKVEQWKSGPAETKFALWFTQFDPRIVEEAMALLIAMREEIADRAPAPRPVEGAGPAHNHPLPWKHKFCPACEYEVAPSPAPPVEAPTKYEMLCVERYHRIQELERTVNALVTLLRAKCTDAQWAELEMKFDVVTEPVSEEALRREFEAVASQKYGFILGRLKNGLYKRTDTNDVWEMVKEFAGSRRSGKGAL